ncbi:unnamed protein product [Tilletia controversa]|uniref:PCI domain-containing protein n=1 Tax=Tilletia controversa TaxID=13291 RepID=A0A8X7SXY1_9BASI|nr:hypothetical protein CF328_g2346 [Tilletia controversa]KAE8250000.1 hypothetical protein A4X06_0g2973 [Tilletia controversa]CAD6963572.1 unnamed protein product [Tilletia controversa]CAD6968871.1 unnamed protein product [Tilletia controversa]CAD6979768.1 unnamed protein product [Tilletia controversa]
MALGPTTRSFLSSLRASLEAATVGGGTSVPAIEGAHSLAAIFSLSQQQHALIQAELVGVSTADDVLADVSRALPASLPGASGSLDLSRFAAFVAELLAYAAVHPDVTTLISTLAAVNGNGGAGGGGGAAVPWDVRAAYEAWSQVYSRAHVVFGMPESFWFIPTLRWLSEALVGLAIKSDTYLQDPKQRNATDSASRLSKSAGLAGNDRTPAPPNGQGTKRPTVMFLANQSFRAYFKLNNVRLCETVLSSVENAIKINRQAAQDALSGGAGGKAIRKRGAAAAASNTAALSAAELDELAQSGYTRADLVTYRYYLGRMRLHQHRLRAAEAELSWAFQNCTDAQPRNKRMILIYLLTAAIPLGRLPQPSLLHAFDLDRQFLGVVEAFRRGAAQAALDALDVWREWHRRLGTYLILREKLQIGLWRNLVRRSLILSRSYLPPSTAPPNIKLSLIAATARLAWQDERIDEADVECITISLIDQGYLKGYIHPDKGLLILQRNDQLGFVNMRAVYQ